MNQTNSVPVLSDDDSARVEELKKAFAFHGIDRFVFMYPRDKDSTIICKQKFTVSQGVALFSQELKQLMVSVVIDPQYSPEFQAIHAKFNQGIDALITEYNTARLALLKKEDKK